MKLKRFLGFMSLAAVLLTFTACSDDDDDDNVVIPLSSYVVGTYTCNVDMVFAYGTQDYEGKTITITANSADANCVDISFADDELGTLNGATGIKVVDNNNGSFALTELECVLAMPTHGGGTSDYACLVSGTISEDHQAFSIVFNVPSVMGGTTYTFTPAN